MTIARFKALCMDASDALVLGRFWATALGAHLVELGEGEVRLDPRPGRPDSESIWIDAVPEPRIGKTRVHLDLRLPERDPGPLVRAGAGVFREPGADAWWVLRDPDGNLFCAFPPRPRQSTPGVFELIVDSGDPAAQAHWWAGLVGGEVEVGDRAASIVGGAGFPWQYWVFDPVPEPKTVKNRIHWDVELVSGAAGDLVDHGARVLRKPGGDISWWVMADPEGNEFCAFDPKR